eukprot:g2199.t1
MIFVLCNSVSFLDAVVPVRTKTIVDVGGHGVYDEIIAMPCAGGTQPSCNRRSKPVSGCLAPFDEEQTLKLRGPMVISQVGVYYPTGGSWNRVSYFDKGGVMDNIVFMGNYGRAHDGTSVDESACHTMPGQNAAIIINGDDFMCHGYNTSYVTPDGKCASKSIQHFDGNLEDTVEVNIMQGVQCGSFDCGYYRGNGHRGWDGNGGSKMFAVKVKYTTGAIHNAPAMWFLHASVLRTANYHYPGLCNCRGVGSPGGCGELDIAEVVTELSKKDEVETSIYSFRGAYSDQRAYKFERVHNKEIVYLTIFNQEGYIQILQLDASEFSFAPSYVNSVVEEWNSKRELVMRMPGAKMTHCGGPKCKYIFSQDGGFAARIADGVICDDLFKKKFSFGRRMKFNSFWT